MRNVMVMMVGVLCASAAMAQQAVDPYGYDQMSDAQLQQLEQQMIESQQKMQALEQKYAAFNQCVTDSMAAIASDPVEDAQKQRKMAELCKQGRGAEVQAMIDSDPVAQQGEQVMERCAARHNVDLEVYTQEVAAAVPTAPAGTPWGDMMQGYNDIIQDGEDDPCVVILHSDKMTGQAMQQFGQLMDELDPEQRQLFMEDLQEGEASGQNEYLQEMMRQRGY